MPVASSASASLWRYQSRSATTQDTAATMKNAWKMSSRPIRDIAKARPSKVIRMPAIAPTIVERDSRRAIRIVMNTSRVPNTSGMNRQPNEFMPNSCSPNPISHLPTGGWTTNSALSLNTLTLPEVIESLAVLGQSFS